MSSCRVHGNTGYRPGIYGIHVLGEALTFDLINFMVPDRTGTMYQELMSRLIVPSTFVVYLGCGYL